MKIITKKITLEELLKMAKAGFGDLVKAVVDVNKEIMAVDGDLHADEEALLLEQSSNQQELWGINIYPSKSQDEWIEFDSLINIRPLQNNRSRGVDDPNLRDKITQIVKKLIE